VPTPFYHLSIANDLLRHPQLAGSVRRKLLAERCTFFFGNTAPDVQVISGQSRQDTHFFTFPTTEATVPSGELLRRSYPQFSDLNQLKPQQAAFIAGYICHLQADWSWVKVIFLPYFGRSCSWGAQPSRLYLHNVLRSYLDEPALRSLPPGIDACLMHIQPEGWLPFTDDEHLRKWGVFLAQQLHPKGRTKTVEVFAERAGLDPEQYNSLLKSEERMDQEIFSHIPRSLLAEYRQDLILSGVRLLNDILA
jgi:hypothetical protein